MVALPLPADTRVLLGTRGIPWILKYFCFKFQRSSLLSLRGYDVTAALVNNVGRNGDASLGRGIYNAYVVQAPWMPPVFEGLKSLTPYIKEDDAHIDFMDINPASRAAVSFAGEVRTLPLDADYIALGW